MNLARVSLGDIGVSKTGGVFNPDGGVVVLPTNELDCFCLDLFATGGAKTTGAVGNQLILPFVDGIDIVDIKPDAPDSELDTCTGSSIVWVISPENIARLDAIRAHVDIQVEGPSGPIRFSEVSVYLR